MTETIRLLSIVVPVFDEEDVIGEFNRRILDTLRELACDHELVYVNDGSRDRTPDILRGFAEQNVNIALVDLSRNFGKEAAMTAGLDHASGDVVVIIDADLQDPPELIREMVRMYAAGGHDVIYAQRTSRRGETFLKKASAHLFYRLIGRVTGIDIPRDTGDFRLMNRRSVNALLQLRERHRFMKGLFAWIGFRQAAMPYDRDPRFAELFPGGHYFLHHCAAQDRSLCRPVYLRGCGSIRYRHRPRNASVRQSRCRLSFPPGGRSVSRRVAAAHTGYYWRIPGTDIQ
jgi:glycosyltransferase involved in cell wall biosynthesis